MLGICRANTASSVLELNITAFHAGNEVLTGKTTHPFIRAASPATAFVGPVNHTALMPSGVSSCVAEKGEDIFSLSGGILTV